MRRKIIRQGNNTLTITLPRAWTKDYRIKAGDELNLELKGNTLIFSTDGKLSHGMQKKDISKLKSILPLVLLSMYRKGYDEIELTFEQKEISLIINNLLNVIGYNVVDQNTNSCLIKALSEVDDINFDEMLRKLFLSIKIKLEKITEAIKEKEVYPLQHVLAMNSIPSKITNYCYRLISKNKLDNPDIRIYYQSLTTDMENLDNQINLIINLLSNTYLNLESAQLFDNFRQFVELYSTFYTSHYSSKIDTFSTVLNQRNLLYENLNLIAGDLNRDESRFFLLLNNSYIYLENMIKNSFIMKL